MVVVGLMWISAAQAVHDTGMFELDGNVVQNSATAPPYDWTSLFGAGGAPVLTPDPSNGPVLADTFVDDTDAVDTTYFKGGTKIDDPVHKMACGGPAANDKTSLDYAYAAVIQVPDGAPDNAGHQVLYFGLEKQAAGNGGDNAFGFWLFKDKNVGCSGSGSFTGAPPTATCSSTACSPTAAAPLTSRSPAGTATTSPARSAQRPSSPAASAVPSPATMRPAESRTTPPSRPDRGALRRRWPLTRSSKPAST